MNSWVGLGFFICRNPSIPKLKSGGLVDLPDGFRLDLAMAGVEIVLQTMTIDPYSSSQPSTTPTRLLKSRMDGLLIDWVDGESTPPSKSNLRLVVRTI